MLGPSRRDSIRRIGSGIVLALAVAACSTSPAGAGPTGAAAGSTPAGPGGAATVPPGSSAPGAATDYCSLFTDAEIGAILGKAVSSGSGSGFVCAWTTADGAGSASIFRSLPGLYEDAVAQPGYRSVSGIGDKAAIGPSALGGIEAIAVANDAYWLVRLDPSPSDDALLGFLRQLLARGQ
jgi:hypothetical protein